MIKMTNQKVKNSKSERVSKNNISDTSFMGGVTFDKIPDFKFQIKLDDIKKQKVEELSK